MTVRLDDGGLCGTVVAWIHTDTRGCSIRRTPTSAGLWWALLYPDELLPLNQRVRGSNP